MEIAEWRCGQGGHPMLRSLAGRAMSICVEVPVDENLGTCTSRTPKKSNLGQRESKGIKKDRPLACPAID